jgi:hypothetical protein
MKFLPKLPASEKVKEVLRQMWFLDCEENPQHALENVVSILVGILETEYSTTEVENHE